MWEFLPMCVYVLDAFRGQKRARGPLGLGLWIVVMHLVELNPGPSSARATDLFNCCTISPAPTLRVYFGFIFPLL